MGCVLPLVPVTLCFNSLDDGFSVLNKFIHRKLGQATESN